MKIKVESDIVRCNVELFKILLRRASQMEMLPSEFDHKTFKGYLHTAKGELRFAEISPEVSPTEHAKWQPVFFDVYVDHTKADKLVCRVLDAQLSELVEANIPPQVHAVLKETIKTIQVMSRLLPKIEQLNRLFLEFSQIQLEVGSQTRKPSGDIIHDAWHQVDRMEAESLLTHEPVGSYLFRKDTYAALLEEQLSVSLREPIKCMTLSYKSQPDRICDLTIVKCKTGWLIYNDDPNLSDPTYPTSDMLLATMSSLLKTPMFH